MTPSSDILESRWIELEGARNVRDLGGLPTNGGGTTRRGVLLRADALDALTASDVTTLIDTIGLRSVIDLRSVIERDERGRGRLGAHEHLAYSEVEVIPAGDVSRRRRSRAAAYASGRAPAWIMADGYIELLDLGAPAFRSVAEAIADGDGGTPALFHCAAGKDRTGVLAAILLDNAGVEPAAIVADYALTDERMPLILERLTGVASFEELAARVPAFTMQAAAATMALFLEHLHTDRGGGHGYLASIGCADGVIDRLRTLLAA